MDININVRAVDGTRTANTSADKQTTNKRSYSPRAKTKKGRYPGYTGISNKSFLKSSVPLFVAAAVKISTLSAMNNIESTITGNRFRQRVRGDLLRTIANPIGMGANIAKENFNQYFNLLRETEKLNYQRELTGFVMPFRTGNAGITL